MSLSRSAGLAAALLIAVTPAQAQEPMIAPQSPAPFLEQPQSLERFFAALDRAEAGHGDRPVHILQLGDSHTVGDLITASLRSRLQNIVGRGGRGALPPGRPYALYNPRQVEIFTQSWTTATAAPGSRDMAGVGLTGSRTLVWGETAELRVEAEAAGAFDRIVLCAVAGPAAGALTAVTRGGRVRADFREAAPGAACRTLRLDAPVQSLVLQGGEAAVDLHSVALFLDRPGVAVSALGVIGSTLADLAVRHEGIARAELDAWRPDLIVLALGTNEGFDPFLDLGAYEARLRGQIARFRRSAPQADLMLLGAPDAMRSEGGGVCEADPEGRWRAPRELILVRNVQRRVAADMGVAFWDWHGRMGGDCSAHRLSTAAEPLMRGDHVHFNSAGGDWIGQMLFEDLTAAWRGRSGGQDDAKDGAGR